MKHIRLTYLEEIQMLSVCHDSTYAQHQKYKSINNTTHFLIKMYCRIGMFI